MKKFEDISWKQHEVIPGGIQGMLNLGNGIELSIVAGPSMYSTPKAPGYSPDDFVSFEVAIFNEDGMVGEPGGWQDKTEINDLIAKNSLKQTEFSEKITLITVSGNHSVVNITN
jgi:hypothetical protein